jgi:hypothetical protein
MGRSLYLIVMLGLLPGALAACVPIASDPARDQFGISTARPDAAAAAPADPLLAELDRKARQICTTGYQGAAPTVEPARQGQQLADQKLRCGHYDRLQPFNFDNVVWSNIF